MVSPPHPAPGPWRPDGHAELWVLPGSEEGPGKSHRHGHGWGWNLSGISCSLTCCHRRQLVTETAPLGGTSTKLREVRGVCKATQPAASGRAGLETRRVGPGCDLDAATWAESLGVAVWVAKSPSEEQRPLPFFGSEFSRRRVRKRLDSESAISPSVSHLPTPLSGVANTPDLFVVGRGTPT